jgi:broad specificity phosphatase PhoE/N-acetylglutamate synthase-like GNAT family acetyltransferase
MAKGEGEVRRSIKIKMIRHAESMNNQMYRDARVLYKGGTPDFDLDGWNHYIDQHRSADPGISDRGHLQAEKLCEYLSPHLKNQASHPVQIITSPMRRTMETILPTIKEMGNDVHVTVNALYHESEGCYLKDVAHPGMNQIEIKKFLERQDGVEFVGFHEDPTVGWYAHGTGAETRAESEERASVFYTWLCEYLDMQMDAANDEEDIYDAGLTLPSEADEQDHDKFSPRQRKRRTIICIGHGDFMSLVLKRVIAGFGHVIEHVGTPHRSAFVHYNTGITELEYFGKGRFLVMSQNSTPHLGNDLELLTGGSLKDGWSYLMPNEEIMLYQEVSSYFADEVDGHVKEQAEALRNLYSSDHTFLARQGSKVDSEVDKNAEMTFVVKRGLQVVGCISFNDETGIISNMIVRPSVKGSEVDRDLLNAVIKHASTAGMHQIKAKYTDDYKTLYENHDFVLNADDGFFVRSIS